MLAGLASGVMRFVFVCWAYRPRRWRIVDGLAEHRRRIVVIQADPTGTAAAGATATADPHGQSCARPVNTNSLSVEDMECCQANVGDFFFVQLHLLADRIRVYAASCGGGVGRER